MSNADNLQGDPRFKELLDTLWDMHKRKAADYGRGQDIFANVRGAEGWGVPNWVGAMIRAEDKMRRLKSYRAKGKLENEGVADAFFDGAAYFLIALIMWEEEQG